MDPTWIKCLVQNNRLELAAFDGHQRMTERLRKWIGRQVLDYFFTEISKEVGVDDKTVRMILRCT